MPAQVLEVSFNVRGTVEVEVLAMQLLTAMIKKLKEEVLLLLKAQGVRAERRARILGVMQLVGEQISRRDPDVDIFIQMFGAYNESWFQVYSRCPDFLIDQEAKRRFFCVAMPWLIHASDSFHDYALVIHMVMSTSTSAESQADESKPATHEAIYIQIYDGKQHLTLKVMLGEESADLHNNGRLVEIVEDMPSMLSSTFCTAVDCKLEPCQGHFTALSSQVGYYTSSSKFDVAADYEADSLLHKMECEFIDLHKDARSIPPIGLPWNDAYGFPDNTILQ